MVGCDQSYREMECRTMPLHNWSDDRGWGGVWLLWLNQLLDWVQPRLPAGFRAYLGAVPALTIDIPGGRPDMGVRKWSADGERAAGVAGTTAAEPDQEAVATFVLDEQRAVHIDLHGQLIAAIELISPRSKDRPAARARYLGRYVGYLRQGVHLLLIDVLTRPAGFSFADDLALELGFPQPPTPPPCAVSYRVGEPSPDGTVIGSWRRPLQIGASLATIPLALNMTEVVWIDLEQTYQQAARRAYLE
jgi:hypothetical protein